ncbi:cytochrome b561 [Collimonas sp. PA-H2]|uniref:cytochrome b n=1 Tax=Collimonas sp. PA-H2 TaxID=1881062 RepID=UPI000C005F51|nr:cytochrome b/b6 domain-containing protein [Collimonas sp. PA-H2]PFH10617.1 cytochrome b561 [Collimonas sp. PA-H2]
MQHNVVNAPNIPTRNDVMSSTTSVSLRYDLFTRSLHWVIAAFIIYTMIEGYALNIISNEKYHHFFSSLNMSIATVIAPLMVIRYLWKFFRPELAYPENFPQIQKSIAHLCHEIFYLAIFMLLATGFLMLEHGYFLFGIIPVARPLNDPDANRLFFHAHRFLSAFVGIMLIFHILALLKHHVINKRDILRRML